MTLVYGDFELSNDNNREGITNDDQQSNKRLDLVRVGRSAVKRVRSEREREREREETRVLRLPLIDQERERYEFRIEN